MRLQTREVKVDFTEKTLINTDRINVVSEDNIVISEENNTISEYVDNHYKSKNQISEMKTTVLDEGETLRLLALELFGDKEFWIYIYQENRDVISKLRGEKGTTAVVISNPNRVPFGLELNIPDTDKYFIDCDNPNSVAKAKLEANKLLERY